MVRVAEPLKQVTEGGCGFSLTGDLKASGHGDEQVALGGPAGEGRLDKLTSRMPLKPQLSCDSLVQVQNGIFSQFNLKNVFSSVCCEWTLHVYSMQ